MEIASHWKGSNFRPGSPNEATSVDRAHGPEPPGLIVLRRFSSIYVVDNLRSDPHVNDNTCPPAIVFSCGKFSGGEFGTDFWQVTRDIL